MLTEVAPKAVVGQDAGSEDARGVQHRGDIIVYSNFVTAKSYVLPHINKDNMFFHGVYDARTGAR